MFWLAIWLAAVPLGRTAFISVDFPSAQRTEAFGINDGGEVVGPSSGGGFLRDTRGNFTRIRVPGSCLTSARGINRRGDVVGFFKEDGCRGKGAYLERTHGFLLRRGTRRFLRMDVPQAVSTQAFGINAGGDVVGAYESADRRVHGYVLRRGTDRFVTLDVPESVYTRSSGINSAGDIVGFLAGADQKTHGYLLRAGTTRYVPLDFPGAMETHVLGINAESQIAGWYTGADGKNHGFVYDGDFRSIDFPGATATFCSGINSHAAVVGSYESGNGKRHAFLLNEGATRLPIAKHSVVSCSGGFIPPCLALAARLTWRHKAAATAPCAITYDAVPRVWEDEAMASLEVPLAEPGVSPVHVPAEYYQSAIRRGP